MSTISAPGKLMLSGEWTVLEKGYPCIVMAVEQRVKAKVTPSDKFCINLNDFNFKTEAFFENSHLELENYIKEIRFTKYAVETTLKYLFEKKITIKTFELETHGEIITVTNPMNGEELKVGFGSSAAAVVSIVAAILNYHDFDIREGYVRDLVFKLAVIAHYYAQGKLGSGFDVAASTFGGILMYKRFDPNWLHSNLNDGSILTVINQDWPVLEYKNISLPDKFELMVGFTGTSASTRKLVKEIREFKITFPSEYWEIMNSIKDVTETLVISLEKGDKSKILPLLDKNRHLLENLSMACSCDLEIEEHRIMSKIASKFGGVAKFSGAGGGDCSVGVSFDKKVVNQIKNEWKKRGIYPIDVELADEGIKIEE